MQFQTAREPDFVPSQTDATRTIGGDRYGIASVGRRLQVGFQRDVFRRELLDSRGGGARHAFWVRGYDTSESGNVDGRANRPGLGRGVWDKPRLGPIGQSVAAIAANGGDEPKHVGPFYRNADLSRRIVLANNTAIEGQLIVHIDQEVHDWVALSSLPLDADLRLKGLVLSVQRHEQTAVVAGVMGQPTLVLLVFDSNLRRGIVARRVDSQLTEGRGDLIGQGVGNVPRPDRTVEDMTAAKAAPLEQWCR